MGFWRWYWSKISCWEVELTLSLVIGIMGTFLIVFIGGNYYQPSLLLLLLVTLPVGGTGSAHALWRGLRDCGEIPEKVNQEVIIFVKHYIQNRGHITDERFIDGNQVKPEWLPLTRVLDTLPMRRG